MDEEEELENMLIGQNQRRANTRPEEIATQFSERSSDLLDTALLGAGATSLAKKVAPESVVSSVGNFLQKNPNLQSVAKNLTSVGGKAAKITNVPLFAYTVADSAVREATGEGISERIGEGIGENLAVGDINKPAFNARERQAIQDGLNVNKPIFGNKRGRRVIVGYEPLSQGAITEDDKIDNLQNALKSVPDTPQVVPGTLPTPQEAGQRLMDAAKEFYPGAFPAEAPAAPAVPAVPVAPAAPALPDPARTGLTTEQMQGLSPDALQAIRTPSIPESVTSAEVPAGLGPMQFIDRETGAPLDPEVVRRVQDAGMERFLAQGAFPVPEAPASLPPMGEAETRARLQQRFGAPTISQLQSVAQPQETERDARVQDRDRRPGESQTERDTRLANEKVTRSVSAQGRRFTDSELRRAFGDGYQEARIKDANGINPFTNKTYEDEKLERENLIADTEARNRTGTDTSDSPTQVIEDARAQAEAMAELYGLTPGTPEYDEYVRSAVAQKVGLPEYFKPKTYTDEEANAAYKAGTLRIGQEYTAPNGEIRVYTGPGEEEKESKPTGKRSSRLNKQIEEDKREQEQKEFKEKQQEESKRDLRREGRN
tara:strand:+ start:5306 stop:7105 length:1800 start_codon:yes stop_codon:yes gene_type:complete